MTGSLWRATPRLPSKRWTALQRLYIHLDMDVHDCRASSRQPLFRRGRPVAATGSRGSGGRDTALPLAAIALTALDPEIGKVNGAVACAVAHIKAVCESWAQTAKSEG